MLVQVDVDRSGIEAGETANLDLFAHRHVRLVQQLLDGLVGLDLRSHQLSNIAWLVGRHEARNVGGKTLKSFSLGNEVGFAVEFEENAML